MDQTVAPSPPKAPLLTIPRWEFIAITAGLMALNALAIDIMLVALQQIGMSLAVEDENSRQLVVTAYIIGFGLTQLLFGPISDRYGRRIPLLVGLGVYVAAAFACAFAPTFTILLVLRFIQGLGAAATRVIAVSLVRDVYGGRAMAEVMSLVFMVFMVIPVVAPGIGQFIMLFSEWPMIFVFIGVMSLAFTIWTGLRLPETLPANQRRPFTASVIFEAFRIVLTERVAISYTIAMTAIFGALFGFINSAQQVYIGIYDVGEMFPLYFALVAGLMAVSSFLNARMVGRFGMRRLAHGALIGFLAVTALSFGLALLGPIPFWLFLTLFAIAMMQFSWIGSNFNSLAMEPLGHVAGTASSVQGFLQTVGGGVVGALIALVMTLVAEKGRLFRSQNAPV